MYVLKFYTEFHQYYQLDTKLKAKINFFFLICGKHLYKLRSIHKLPTPANMTRKSLILLTIMAYKHSYYKRISKTSFILGSFDSEGKISKYTYEWSEWYNKSLHGHHKTQQFYHAYN